jgi:hypothetical protein
MLFNNLKDDNYYRAFPLVDKYWGVAVGSGQLAVGSWQLLVDS